MTVPARSLPMWLFIAFALFLNVALPPIIDRIEFGGFDERIQALLFLAGTLVGECCFVATVSGLTKRTWLGRSPFWIGNYRSWLYSCDGWFLDGRRV